MTRKDGSTPRLTGLLFIEETEAGDVTDNQDGVPDAGSTPAASRCLVYPNNEGVSEPHSLVHRQQESEDEA